MIGYSNKEKREYEKACCKARELLGYKEVDDSNGIDQKVIAVLYYVGIAVNYCMKMEKCS